MDRPVRAQGNALVHDAALGGALPGLRVAEEEQVAGAHVLEGDPLRARYLAGLGGGRAAADTVARRQPGGLEDPPREARAVVTPVGLAAIERRPRVGLAAPDVGHAD